MHCVRCGKSSYVKNGVVRGLQRYRCTECGYNFTNTHGRGYPPALKIMALKLYREGLGLSSIGRILNVDGSTVYHWMRDAGEKIKQQILSKIPEDQSDMDIIEIDEMWHYTKKNSENFGYGLLCLAPQDASLPWKWALVVPNLSKDSGPESNT